MKKLFTFFAAIFCAANLLADTPAIITIAEALAIGDTLATGVTSEEVYAIDGYVVATEDYSTQYKNQNFWIVDQLGAPGLPLYVYHGKSNTPIQAGYHVRFDCKIQNYSSNHIIEAVNPNVVIVDTTVLTTDPVLLGDCGAQGNNLTWHLNLRSGRLTVAGSGAMVDSVRYVPWQRQTLRKYVRKASLPDGLTNIGISAFDRCVYLDSVVIPETVTKIGKWAFYGCSRLTSLNLPESVDSIGIPAFNGCSLTEPLYNSTKFCFLPTDYVGSYTVPDGITSVIAYAFWDRKGLTEVVLPPSLRHISYRSFASCTGLQSMKCWAATPPACHYEQYFDSVDKTIPLYVPARSIELYRQAEGWSEFTNIQPLTEGEQEGFDQITNDQSPMTIKVIRDGQLLILRDGKTYNALGIEIR